MEKLTLSEIRELLECRDAETLRGVLDQWMHEDVADLIEDLASHEIVDVLDALDPEHAARAFEHVSPTVQ